MKKGLTGELLAIGCWIGFDSTLLQSDCDLRASEVETWGPRIPLCVKKVKFIGSEQKASTDRLPLYSPRIGVNS